MLRKRIAKRDRGTLVEEHAHSGGSQRAPLRMLQDGAHLFRSNTREPLNELGDQGTVFDVLEQGCYRHSGASEHPCSAHPIRVPLDGGAG